MSRKSLVQGLKEEQAAIAMIHERLDVEAREMALKPFLEGTPYDRNGLIEKGKEYLVQEARGSFGLGCVLIVLREKESWKETIRIAKEQFGISQATAYRHMSRARKITRRPSLISAVGAMDVRKIGAILDLPDDDLDEFEQEGTILGKALDEIDAMAPSEVQALARKQKKKLEKARQKEADKEQLFEQIKAEKADLQATIQGQVITGDEAEILKAINKSGTDFFTLMHHFKTGIDYKYSKVTASRAIGELQTMSAFLDDAFNHLSKTLPLEFAPECSDFLDATEETE